MEEVIPLEKWRTASRCVWTQALQFEQARDFKINACVSAAAAWTRLDKYHLVV